MSTSYCISCDLEICRHQLHFDPMLARPYDHHLPDEWITLVKGDPQIHKAYHFCSYLCLSEWVSLEREKERKAELENMHRLEAEDKKLKVSQRTLTMKFTHDLFRYAGNSGFIHARDRTLQELFANRFPDISLNLNIADCDGSVNIWCYTFPDPQEKHIQWAKMTTDCGLIDSYIVDEVPV